MPKLAALAKSYLAAPASSAAAERLFSRCTDVMRQKKRNRLEVETINAMLLTNCLIERCSIFLILRFFNSYFRYDVQSDDDVDDDDDDDDDGEFSDSSDSEIVSEPEEPFDPND